MKNITKVVDDIVNIKMENNPTKLIEYILCLNGEYLPSSIMLDKARAIQLNEDNKYSLDDAHIIIKTILEIEPDYVPAYIEMGYFYDAVMNDPQSAITVLDDGISKAQQLLDELYLGKAEALRSIGKLKEAAKLERLVKIKESKSNKPFNNK